LIDYLPRKYCEGVLETGGEQKHFDWGKQVCKTLLSNLNSLLLTHVFSSIEPEYYGPSTDSNFSKSKLSVTSQSFISASGNGNM
jgi:hypothetical protein